MTTATEKTTATELKALDPRRRQLLKDYFLDIAAALPILAEQLEFADLDLGGEGGPLLELHLVVCEMMNVFKDVDLGKHL